MSCASHAGSTLNIKLWCASGTGERSQKSKPVKNLKGVTMGGLLNATNSAVGGRVENRRRSANTEEGVLIVEIRSCSQLNERAG